MKPHWQKQIKPTLGGLPWESNTTISYKGWISKTKLLTSTDLCADQTGHAWQPARDVDSTQFPNVQAVETAEPFDFTFWLVKLLSKIIVQCILVRQIPAGEKRLTPSSDHRGPCHNDLRIACRERGYSGRLLIDRSITCSYLFFNVHTDNYWY